MIVTIHSFRGGAGKSTLTTNLAYQLAKLGKTVCLVDADMQSPALHTHFGIRPAKLEYTLNEVIKKEVEVQAASYDVSKIVGLNKGKITLVPSRMDAGVLTRNLLKKREEKQLQKTLKALEQEFDIVLVDTHPGINTEMLVTGAVSDLVLLLVRPDNQDYQGLEIAQELLNQVEISFAVVMNKLRAKHSKVPALVKKKYKVDVVGTLPLSKELIEAETKAILSEQSPKSGYVKQVGKIVKNVF